MKRPVGMTDQNNNTIVSGVVYGPANELDGISYLGYTETRGYNTMFQLTSINGNTYSYPTNGTNIGKISSQVISGETVTYTYVLGDPVNLLDPAGLFCLGANEDLLQNASQHLGVYNPCEAIQETNGGSGKARSVGCPTWGSELTYNYSLYNELMGTVDPLPDPACYAPPPPPPPQDPPSCWIALFKRPAFINHNPGKHTYILVYDSALTQSEQMIEGGSVDGLLTGYDSAPGQGLGAGTSHASDPTASNNHEIGNGFSGPTACDTIDLLLSFEQSYNGGPRVPYSPVPLPGSGYWNSNSFTYTLLRDVGLSRYFGHLTWIQYPGWGMTVPGL